MAKARVALLVALALLLAACAAEEGGRPTATPATPAVTATPAAPEPSPAVEPSVTPVVIGGVEAQPLTIGDVAQLPANVAVIVETGCYNCGAPPSGFLRVYRNSSGRFRRDTLLAADSLALGPRAVQSDGGAVRGEPLYMTGRAFSTDAWQAVVGVCTRGSCIELGESPSADAETTLFRSQDGGVTWQEWATIQGSALPLAMGDEGVLLAHFSAERPESMYELVPGREPVEPPESDVGWPMMLPDGELLWPTDDGRILNSDGSTFLDVGTDTALVYQFSTLVSDPDGDELLFMMIERSVAGSVVERNFLFTTDREGRVMRAFSTEFLPWLGAWVGPDLFLGNVDIPADQAIAAGLPELTGPMPVLLDLEAGVAHPIIEPFSDPDFPQGRNFLKHVQRGPFARVVGTGSCLNIRAEPGVAARVLDCAADGVLLRDTGETRQADGAAWLRVATPAGAAGWASMDYLER